MPRYLDTLQNDVTEGNDGDVYFIGVNNKLSPELLGEGLCASATNKIFNNGRASTRGGLSTPINFDIGTSTTIYGASTFTDAYGRIWVLLAASDKVYRLRWDSTPRIINIQGNITNSDSVYMVDGLNRVVMFRGEENSYVVWEWNKELEYFLRIPEIATSSYTLMPQASEGVLYKNRIWTPYSIDSIAASNALEYYQYDAVLNDFRIGAGANDGKIIKLFPFHQNTMIVFKRYGSYLMSNIITDADGEISTNIRIEVLNNTIGCVASNTVVMVGKEAFYLSDDGVRKITQNLEGLTESIVAPVSDELEKTMERINPQYASGSYATTDGRYYYLAAPMDDSTYNNELHIFDARTMKWMGSHTFPSGVRLDFLLKSEYLYKTAILAINSTNGDVYLLNNGFEDRLVNTVSQISDSVTSRGYLVHDNEPKAFRRIRVAVDSLNPSISISIKTDGEFNETSLISNKTFDNTKYTTWSSVDYNASNVNDDHATKNREDYSMDVGTPFYLKTNGVQFDRIQNTKLSSTTLEQSRYAQIKVNNSNAVCELVSIGVECRPEQRQLRSKR